MKRNRMKLKLISFICAVLTVYTLCAPVYANSAQTHVRGEDATGAIMDIEGSPIVVEKERLTFDIQELSSDYYQTEENPPSYTPTVTAEYSFYNPSEYTVTATLFFPFGRPPSDTYKYHYHTPEAYQSMLNSDSEQYSITINGAEVEKKLRYTMLNVNDSFHLERDLALLSDGLVKDDFFSPDMTVTYYYIDTSEIDFDAYQELCSGVNVPQNNGRSLMTLSNPIYTFPQEAGFLRLYAEIDKLSATPTLIVFGEPLDVLSDCGIYTRSGSSAVKLPIEVKLRNKSTKTYAEFVFSSRIPTSPISETDWYNLAVATMNRYRNKIYCNVSYNPKDSDFYRNMMRWYEYEITLAPGERIVNTVTAPIYPGIDLTYDPDVYEYTYLLSPAKTWKSFGELEIIINTPYHLTESSLSGFRKAESGYSLTHTGLPDGELTFSLCTVENPIQPNRNAKPLSLPWIAIFSYGGAALVIGGLTAFFLIRRKRKHPAK